MHKITATETLQVLGAVMVLSATSRSFSPLGVINMLHKAKFFDSDEAVYLKERLSLSIDKLDSEVSTQLLKEAGIP